MSDERNNHIKLDARIQAIVMPENVKIGQMVRDHRRSCKNIGCSFDYHAFAIGQSPFPIPESLSKGLSKNAHQGHYSASQGLLELRKAIADFNNRHFGFEIDPDLVVLGHGTKGMIFTIFSMIHGDVIIPAPSWVSYVPQIVMLGKNYHLLDLKPENKYKLQPEDLDKFLSSLHDDQHLLVINSPHNPTGSVYSRKELEELADICRKHEILVLSDEIYALYTYDFNKFTSIRDFYPEGTFVTNGISKDRSAAGYRLGHCILPDKCSETLRSAFNKIAGTVYTNVSTPTQYGAIDSYRPNTTIDEYFLVTREIHRIMGTNLSGEFNKLEGLRSIPPEGGFYFLVDFNDIKEELVNNGVKTSNDLAPALLSHPYHIAALSGDSILLNQNDFGIRIAFVDYDGKQALRNYLQNPPKTKSDEIDFLEQNAPRMINAIESLQNHVEALG
jgi:aspartate aminotransferase